MTLSVVNEGQSLQRRQSLSQSYVASKRSQTEAALREKLAAAAGQYKNCKSFINLCYHLEDFGVPAAWHFFATSHGMGPCDGVGGAVKKHAAKASSEHAYSDQITTPQGPYWAVEGGVVLL